MSTVKITQLTESVSLNANTANTILLGVDLPTSTTVKFTLGTLVDRILSTTAVNSYANGAFAQANNAFSKANLAFDNSNTVYNVANSAGSYANSAFAKANNALANTTGTFGGSLTIAGNETVTGNITSNYSITIDNTSMPGNGAFLIITGAGGVSAPSNPGYTIQTVGPNGVGNRIAGESYGSGANNYVAFVGRRARGTAASPAAVQNGDILTRLGGNGYGSSKFSQYADARIEFVATETHTNTSKGTQIQFWTTPSGANTPSQVGTMNGNSASFSGTVNAVKGFIHTTNNITTNSTTYTVDFQRDSIVRMSVNDNMTITLQNYVEGKMVEVLITNSAAQNKTITHGCLANNSTSKQTTFTIGSQACAFLRYFSIDGDQANTFVSIVA